MEKEYKCIKCEEVFPRDKMFFKCNLPECTDSTCNHGAECGLCLLLSIPSGASINMDALLKVL